MNIGDVVAMNGCKIEFGTKAEGGNVTYRAPKGERFVFLLLGSTPIDGSAPLDPDGVLKELGWSHPSPEVGDISREEIAREIDAEAFSKNPWDATEALAMSKRRVAALDKADAKLKENGLSREGLGGSVRVSEPDFLLVDEGSAQSQPGSDAQERSPVPPSQGGGANPSDGSGA